MPNSFDFTDSFSHYTTFQQLTNKWPKFANPGAALLPSIGGAVSVGAAIGAASQGYQSQNNRIAAGVPSGPSRKFYFKMRFSALSAQTFAWFFEPTERQLRLDIDGSGHIVGVRGSGTTIVTSTLTLAANTTYSVAVEITIDPSAGVLNVWINGTAYIAFTGNTRNTANSLIDTFSIGNNGVGNFKFGDVLVYPSTMTTIMTANVNPYKVNANGPRTAFNRGGVDLGTNALQISKALATTTNFNFSNLLGDRDNFGMDPVPSGTLLGARLWANAQKDGVGLRSMALTVENGVSDSVGVDQALTSNGYGFYGRDASSDPATAALWASLAALNGAKMGYKVTV